MSESKSPRRPGGRRPVPPLIFLLVLAILALFVWWKVIRTDEDRTKAESAPCTLSASPEQLAQLQNMGNIQINVLNGSSQSGLAASIQAELVSRGFTVLDIGNAPSDQAVSTAGKVIYPSGKAFEANVVAANFVDFEIERSTAITDGTLTVIAGQAYGGPADPNQSSQEVTSLIEEQAKIVAGCPAPSEGS
ncbi:hypothetical protein EK0264_17865 [Epidermidibacterium keratini]|uniref:LytR/CpsA/Psr regulator C-terminal domain-containing protein n=1 Tax=Epidermidibacterium keratini TaxID=1891644 RepID=A0A7L4YTY5_9ACTN|nr:LytR C-terminal domain-containing protein [Epidermidibacterium keratini]QHC01957.1 hypothetical protein EK0264_17865 [Epidermidibacterium keratini]